MGSTPTASTSFFDQTPNTDSALRRRARGCLLGQLVGDALGSAAEFLTPAEIAARYPDGLRELLPGVHGTIPGQPTDDSELALLLARSLVERGTWDRDAVLEAYHFWFESDPFDCGNTIAAALAGKPDPGSQANGAMMRISPLGIFGASHPVDLVVRWAEEDAALTHPNLLVRQANVLYSMAIALAVRQRISRRDLFRRVSDWASELDVDPLLRTTIDRSADHPPGDFVTHQGWVVIAFGNALHQLLHAPSFEDALVDTVSRGGDADTNAAICGALIGAVEGIDAIPRRWIDTVLACRPAAGDERVVRPRPQVFWPVDAIDLADALVGS